MTAGASAVAEVPIYQLNAVLMPWVYLFKTSSSYHLTVKTFMQDGCFSYRSIHHQASEGAAGGITALASTCEMGTHTEVVRTAFAHYAGQLAVTS